jgi:hypothetical protein
MRKKLKKDYRISFNKSRDIYDIKFDINKGHFSEINFFF